MLLIMVDVGNLGYLRLFFIMACLFLKEPDGRVADYIKKKLKSNPDKRTNENNNTNGLDWDISTLCTTSNILLKDNR